MNALNKLVALCDELCLSYDRGSSCTDIMDTANIVLGCVDEECLSLKILKEIEAALDDITKSKITNSSTIETCGIRMYNLLQKLYAENFKDSEKVLLLRVMAVRCIHLGFSKKNQKYRDFLNFEPQNEDIQNKKAEKIKKSVIEILKAYARTAKRLEILSNRAKVNLDDIIYFTLSKAENLEFFLNGIKLVQILWGHNNLVGDTYAEEFVCSAMQLSLLEIKLAPEQNITSLLARWMHSVETLKSAFPTTQFKVTRCIRTTVSTILQKNNKDVTEACISLLRINLQIFHNLRNKGNLICIKERVNEIDDLILLGYQFLKVADMPNAILTLEHLDSLKILETSKNHNVYKISHIKYLLLKFEIEQAKFSEAVDISEDFRKVVDFALNSETKIQYRISMMSLILSSIYRICSANSFQSGLVLNYFLKTDDIFSKIKDGNCDDVNSTLYKWRAKFLRGIVEANKTEENSGVWGVFLQKLKKDEEEWSKNSELAIEVLYLVWQHAKESFENDQFLKSKTNFEYIIKEIKVNKQTNTLTKLKNRCKFALALILGKEEIKVALDKKAKINLLNKAILHLLDVLDLSHAEETTFIETTTALHLELSINLIFLRQEDGDTILGNAIITDLFKDLLRSNRFKLIMAVISKYDKKSSLAQKKIFHKVICSIENKACNFDDDLTTLGFIALQIYSIPFIGFDGLDKILEGTYVDFISSVNNENETLNGILKLLKYSQSCKPMLLKAQDVIFQSQFKIDASNHFDDTNICFVLTLAWNLAVVGGKLQAEYEIDFKKLLSNEDVNIISYDRMILSFLKVASTFATLIENINCCCLTEVTQGNKVKRVEISSSIIYLQYFKGVLSFIVSKTVNASFENLCKLEDQEIKLILEICREALETVDQYQKFVCQSCSTKDKDLSLCHVISGTKLITQLFLSEFNKDDVNIQKYDILTFCKEFCAESNLNPCFVYDLAIFCKILGAKRCCKELFETCFQLECLKPNVNVKKCGHIVHNLMTLNVTVSAKKKWIAQFFQICNKKQTKITVNGEIVKIMVAMASHLWNIVGFI